MSGRLWVWGKLSRFSPFPLFLVCRSLISSFREGWRRTFFHLIISLYLIHLLLLLTWCGAVLEDATNLFIYFLSEPRTGCNNVKEKNTFSDQCAHEEAEANIIACIRWSFCVGEKDDGWEKGKKKGKERSKRKERRVCVRKGELKKGGAGKRHNITRQNKIKTKQKWESGRGDFRDSVGPWFIFLFGRSGDCCVCGSANVLPPSKCSYSRY